MFHNLDDLILDNICDRVRPLVYSKDEKVKKRIMDIYQKADMIYQFTEKFHLLAKTDNQRRGSCAKNGVHCSWTD